MEAVKDSRPLASPSHSSTASVWWARFRSSPVALLLLLAALGRVAVWITAQIAVATSGDPRADLGAAPWWARPFVHWDSGFYLDIAQHGYAPKEELWAFHPGYPLAMAGVKALLPGAPIEGIGFVLSHVFFFAMVPVAYYAQRRLVDERVAFRATAVLALFPGGFFFSAVYPESLFMLAVAAFLWAVGGSQWIVAGLCASVAAAARPHGLLLAPVLAFAVWQARPHGLRQWATALAGLALSGLFAVVHSWHAWTQTGDPLMWLHAREEHWKGVAWRQPFDHVWNAMRHPWASNGLPAIGVAFVVAGVAYCVVKLWRRRRAPALPGYAFSLLVFAVTLSYSDFSSVLRYVVPAIAVHWMLAVPTWRTRWFAVVLGANAALLLWVAWLFATWKHVV